MRRSVAGASGYTVSLNLPGGNKMTSAVLASTALVYTFEEGLGRVVQVDNNLKLKRA